MVDKLGLDYSILSDPDAEVIGSWGLLHRGGGVGGADIARPATFIVAPDGRIAWRNVPENWRVRIRPETLIAALEDLGS